MYNEKVKSEMLDSCNTPSMRRYYAGLFKRTEPIEEKHQKDLACIPIEITVKAMLDAGHIGSLATMQGTVYKIRSYMKWAIVQGYTPPEYRALPAEKLNLKSLFEESIRGKITLFKNPQQLISYMEELRKPDYTIPYSTKNTLFCAYFCLIYQGFKPEIIFDLQISDLKLDETYAEFRPLFSHLLTNRTFMRLNNFAKIPMGNTLLDFGKPDLSYNGKYGYLHSRKIKTKPVPKTTEVYIMGKIFANNAEDFRRILLDCYGKNCTQNQRDQVRKLYKLWTE